MRWTLRIIIRLILAIVIIAMAVFAVANRSLIKIDLSPLPFMPEAPLFAIILGAMCFGLIVGSGLSSLSRHKLKWQLRARDKLANNQKREARNKTVPHGTSHKNTDDCSHKITLNDH